MAKRRTAIRDTALAQAQTGHFIRQPLVAPTTACLALLLASCRGDRPSFATTTNDDDAGVPRADSGQDASSGATTVDSNLTDAQAITQQSASSETETGNPTDAGALSDDVDASSLEPQDARAPATQTEFDAQTQSDARISPDARFGCGDGQRSEGEVCDDGNTMDDDGCNADCTDLAPGFTCSHDDQPCLALAVCGDGIVAATEQCDDGDVVSSDGCSDRCRIEQGHKCQSQPSICGPTECGDGVREGVESCDDGNRRPFDGCSEVCEPEPDCSPGNATCTRTCGDGLVFDEDCDDGNLRDGDGCSSECEVEQGYACETAPADCEAVNGECVIKLSVVFRDHAATHPDFGTRAEECTMTPDGAPIDQIVPANVVTEGMVQATLGTNGLPVLQDGNQACHENANKPSYLGIEQFEDWFVDGPNAVTFASDLLLFDNSEGGYTNRFTPQGERFPGYVPGSEVFDAEGDLLCSWCFDAECEDPCDADASLLDGNPLFFPVDDVVGLTNDPGAAKIPSTYGFVAEPFEEHWGQATTQAYTPLHNFHFTTELRTWFRYSSNLDAALSFEGDDDVWVFVNRRLALDLGGLHEPARGEVQINANSASAFGLVEGQVYELALFHAERRGEVSSFALSLTGFTPLQSNCTALCGDGILAFGEQCDQGTADNIGGYGGCTSSCLLDEFCGDGVVNGPEQCDPPSNAPDANCINCRH